MACIEIERCSMINPVKRTSNEFVQLATRTLQSSQLHLLPCLKEGCMCRAAQALSSTYHHVTFPHTKGSLSEMSGKIRSRVWLSHHCQSPGTVWVKLSRKIDTGVHCEVLGGWKDAQNDLGLTCSAHTGLSGQCGTLWRTFLQVCRYIFFAGACDSK